MKPWERVGERVTQGPLRDYRHPETWWWVRPDGSSVGGVGETVVRRAQRIFGGRVEVIRQTITTETTVSEVIEP